MDHDLRPQPIAHSKFSKIHTKLVKRGAVRANDLPLSNDLEAWPDSSVDI